MAVVVGCSPEDMTTTGPTLGGLYNPMRVTLANEQDQQDFVEGALFNGLAETINKMTDPLKCSENEPSQEVVSKPIEPDQNYPFGSPLEGALRILTSKYQTCKILTNIGGSESFEGKTPAILEVWKRKNEYPNSKPNPACKDSTTLSNKLATRNIYKSKAKVLTSPLEYSQGWRGPEIRGNNLLVHESATDCSSFVSGALMAVGLKMSKNSTQNNFLSTTATIESDIESGKSCFEKIEYSGVDDVIRSGDVLNDSRGGHVVMVDRLGEDPLGIKKVLSPLKTEGVALDSAKKEAAEKCKMISLKDMDLTIVHSTTSKTGNGIVRETANAIQSGSAVGILVNHARYSCLRLLNVYPQQASFNSSKGVCPTCSILRHKGTKDPLCVLKEKPKVQGEECINECLQNFIKS